MKEHFFDFMQKVIDNHQAEPAPQLQLGHECWYLPTFGVYHHQKPGKIRVVFDSSAEYKGASLNDAVLCGPNLNNTLIGLLRLKDNNPDKEIIDNWMTVHMFGNSPSPAVAIYGMRKAAEQGETEYGTDAKHIIFRNFYVDDGLTSVTKEDDAIDLL